MFIVHFSDQSDRRHSEPEKKMFSTVFSESRDLPQKKTTFWILQKKPKVKQKKLRIATKTSRTTQAKLQSLHTLIRHRHW